MSKNKLGKRLGRVRGLVLGSAVAAVSVIGSSAHAGSLAVGDYVTAYLDGSLLGTSTSPGLFNQSLTYNVTEAGVPHQSGSSLYYGGQIGWDQAKVQTSVNGTLQDGSAFGLTNNQYNTFCTELTTDVYIGTTDKYQLENLNQVSDISNSSSGGMAVALAIDEIINYAEANGGLNSANASMGAQVAIWKTIYDYNTSTGSASLNRSTGQIQWASGGAGSWQSDACAYLTAVGNTSYTSNYSVLGLQSTTGVQNQSIIQVIPTTTGGASPTPLPKSLAGGLALLGLVGVGAGARRGKQIA